MSVLAFLKAFVFCYMAGLGPAMCLMVFLRRPRGQALAWAPALGLVLAALITTALTFLGHPSGHWSWLITSTTLVLSLVLVVIAAWVGPTSRGRSWPHLLLPGSAWVLALLLLALPPMLGGLRYSVVRGNWWDALNYSAMAQGFGDWPLQEFKANDLQALADLGPGLPACKRLLRDRVTTGLLLRLSADQAGSRPVHWVYGFSLLCFAAGFPLLWLLARAAGAGVWSACLASFAGTLGFWAQLSLDSNALSQISAFPSLFMAVICIDQAFRPGEAENLRARAAVLAGVFFACLFILYAEICVLAGMAFLVFIAMHKGQALKARVTNLAWVCVGLLIVALPFMGHYLPFLAHQLGESLRGSDFSGWFYGWLYRAGGPQKILAAFWGFHHTLGFASGWPQALAGCGLCLAGFLALRRVYAGRETAAAGFCTWGAATGLLLAFCLMVLHRYWAAGKMILWSFPFIIVALSSRSAPPWARCLVLSWFAFQASLGGYRVVCAAQGQDYPLPYPSTQEPWHKDIGYDLSPLEAALLEGQSRDVAVDLSTPFSEEVLEASLPYVTWLQLNFIPENHLIERELYQSSGRLPVWLVTDQARGGLYCQSLGSPKASNASYLLFPLSTSGLDSLLEHSRPLDDGFGWVKVHGLRRGKGRGGKLDGFVESNSLRLYFLASGRRVKMIVKGSKAEAVDLDGKPLEVRALGKEYWEVFLPLRAGTNRVCLRWISVAGRAPMIKDLRFSCL